MAYLISSRRADRPRLALAPLALSLGLLLALLAGLLATVRAADDPSIMPFNSAHVRIDGSISAQGQERPVQGEGDVDARKGAMRLTATLLGATSETIAIDGRTYSRNATTGNWGYTAGGGGGFEPIRLVIYDPKAIRAAGQTFTRVGAETINGEATTHWRTDVDLVALLGALPGADGATVRLTSSTMNLWLGDGDGRLRQLALDGQGTAASNNTTNAYHLALNLTYSQFDTDVAIIAPTGAVAATPTRGGTPGAVVTGGVPGSLPVATLTPIGEATSDAGLFSATHLVRLVAILSLIVIGAVLVVAVRRGGRRQGTPPPPRSTRSRH